MLRKVIIEEKISRGLRPLDPLTVRRFAPHVRGCKQITPPNFNVTDSFHIRLVEVEVEGAVQYLGLGLTLAAAHCARPPRNLPPLASSRPSVYLPFSDPFPDSVT